MLMPSTSPSMSFSNSSPCDHSLGPPLCPRVVLMLVLDFSLGTTYHISRWAETSAGRFLPNYSFRKTVRVLPPGNNHWIRSKGHSCNLSDQAQLVQGGAYI